MVAKQTGQRPSVLSPIIKYMESAHGSVTHTSHIQCGEAKNDKFIPNISSFNMGRGINPVGSPSLCGACLAAST